MENLTAQQILVRMSAARKLRETATDADASLVIGIYSTMKCDGSLIRVGTRIRFGDKLYRARVDLWDTAEYTPDAVPLLWDEVLYKNGHRIITNITAENPFANGDKGWYNGVLYQSKLDNNVWTPDEFPAGWVITDEGGNE